MTNKNQTIAIIQARMSSSRLQGKVLKTLAEKEVLYHIWNRLTKVKKIDKIVVATTAEPENQPIIDYCNQNKIEIFAYAGPINDLLNRYISCGDHYNADIIVMVDGDCPLLHPPTIDRMIESLLEETNVDYSRLSDRSIEGGIAVLRLKTYKSMAQQTDELCYHEHATMFLVENPHLFNIAEVDCEDDFKNIKHRLWLDTEADYTFLSEIYSRLYKPNEIVNLHDVVLMIKSDPELRQINQHVTQKNIHDKSLPFYVISNDLLEAQKKKAFNVLTILTEKYHAGINIINQENDGFWAKTSFKLVKSVTNKKAVVLELNNNNKSFVPIISDTSDYHIRIGLESVDTEDNIATLVANYSGHRDTCSGYTQIETTDRHDEARLDDVLICSICGNNKIENIWKHETGITNGICSHCGHVFLTKQLPQSAIDKSYKDYKQSYTDSFLKDTSNPIFDMANKRHDFLLQNTTENPKSILEIGCGYGNFLNKFNTSVLRVGIEPSLDQTRFAKENFKIAEIWETSFETITQKSPTWPKDGFDAVCSFHVLEHIKQPVSLMNFAKKMLKNGGYLFLTVPDLLALHPNLMELYFIYRNWHIHTFSKTILSYLLTNNGFEIVEVTTEESTSMSKSSLGILARKKTSTKPVVIKNNIEQYRNAITAFHYTLNTRLSKIRETFEGWSIKNKKVAVYGGGLHTKALLELTGIKTKHIDLIIDDDPGKQGTKLSNIPIYKYDQAMKLDVDVIVVSSLASEHLILNRLANSTNRKIEIIGIYRDLMK